MEIIYTQNGKNINFIDENNVLLGFDIEQQCCEDFDWFLTKGHLIAGERYKNLDNLDDYVFDPNYFKEGNIEGNIEDENYIIFKLRDNTNYNIDYYLVLVNAHNGYYAHGFKFCNGEIVVKEGSF